MADIILDQQESLQPDVKTRYQDMLDGTIDFGGPAPAAFVGDPAGISHARKHQTMFDMRQHGFVLSQPGNRANGPGNPYKTIRVTQRSTPEMLRQFRRHGHPRKVVIGKGGMAGMR